MIRYHEFPVIGSWYQDLERNERFEVVATDPKEENIEIQYFSGEIEELEASTWYDMQLQSIAPPKDWSGPFEMEQEELADLDQTDKAIHPINWDGPKSHLELEGYEADNED